MMTIHVRFEGKSFDLDGRNLSLNTQASDREIRNSLARYLEVEVGRFQDYVIDRRPSGAVVVRPEAVYG
ncbi:MAG: hypothetical protein AB7S38_23795 [Vulcanimicrobiota bacterium]